MGFVTLILLALALAMDAFVVSVASGLAAKRLSIKHAFTVGLWFGTFQALMPFLGWLGGMCLQELIAAVGHWIAFTLLSGIGAKMIWESFRIDRLNHAMAAPGIRVLFVLSIATSIDAFAVGVTMAALDVSILMPVLIIGLVTFVASASGVWLGSLSRRFSDAKLEILAGLILIGIGIRMLVDHFVGRTSL